MTKQQRQIVRDYISLSHRRVSTHLRSLGLLNNNSTLPSGEGAQINLERWFFGAINSDGYTLSVTDAGGVEVNLEIGSFDSHSGNPVIFEFDAAAWPSLLEEAVLVSVEKGVVNRPDVFIEPHIMVDICGDSLAASYQDLFINDDLGAIADLPGMTNALQVFIWKLIDAEQDSLIKAVLQYAGDLVNFDEDGNVTPESRIEVAEWLEKNDDKNEDKNEATIELKKGLGRIIESGVVG
tara:strand:+ start:223 stop:933 length:711 start_codon:yes stop_codon:yes gene_type:complete